MKLALVGVGGAGGRIVERIHASERRAGRTFSNGNVLVFDTEAWDGDAGELPRDQYISIGDTHRAVGEEGVDGDPELAAEVTREERHDIRRVCDFLDIERLDGILLVAGLGGGTGCGVGAVLVEEFTELYEKPVYVLGVLPGEDEGDRPALNAARALRSLVPTADNVLLFDNDAWHSGEGAIEAEYGRMNSELAARVTALLGAGELDGAKVAENAIDTSDLIRTLATGGVSSIGQASLEVDAGPTGIRARVYDLLGIGEDVDAADPTAVKRLVREALESDLTLPCEVTSAERTLIVLSGPSPKLSRRGFESARHLLEQETDTVEVLAGDEPNDGASALTATVLLSNVTDVPRIDALQERAVAFQEQGSEELASRTD